MDGRKFGGFDPESLRLQLREEDEGKMQQRIERLQRVRVHKIIPHVWFDFASTECHDLFRDGHYYGCICLSQSVAEGLAKFILERHKCKVGKQGRPIESCKKPATSRGLIKMLKGLKGGVRNGSPMAALSSKCLEAFDRLEGGDRDDFHHLNRSVTSDRVKLEKRAEECVRALYDIESELFEFSVSEGGALIPHQPLYWPDAGKYARVFLRSS